MLNAIATVVWPKGLLGGYEFELTLLTVAIALAATGRGRVLARRRDRLGGRTDRHPLGVSSSSPSRSSSSLITTTLGRGTADLDEIPG